MLTGTQSDEATIWASARKMYRSKNGGSTKLVCIIQTFPEEVKELMWKFGLLKYTIVTLNGYHRDFIGFSFDRKLYNELYARTEEVLPPVLASMVLEYV